MYRSQLKLDILDPSVQRALHDANDMHRNLMKAFDDIPSDSPRAEHALLYALMDHEGRPALYVLSASRPDWSRVRGVEPISAPMDISALQEKLEIGDVYRFRLFASPTKKVSREGKLSARVFLRTEEERREWMLRRAESAGFELLFLSELKQTRVCGSKKGTSINYTGVLFTGALRITDKEAFWQAYSLGIGPGKSYGLGLLLISRV